jgi:diacylglycerol kinase (ATP)
MHATTRVPAFSVSARLRSFVHAGRGIRTLLVSQHNARIHAVATAAVIAAGFAAGVSRLEWVALVVAIVSVWTAECLNTAFELVCDVASPEFHPLVRCAKDIAAAAVLICSAGAAVTGVVILGPHALTLVSRFR